MMETRDLAVSAGSACTSASVEPSHVLLGIGLTKEEAHESDPLRPRPLHDGGGGRLGRGRCRGRGRRRARGPRDGAGRRLESAAAVRRSPIPSARASPPRCALAAPRAAGGDVRVSVSVTTPDRKTVPGAGAVVWVVDPAAARAAAATARPSIASKKKRFDPHVTAVPEGARSSSRTSTGSSTTCSAFRRARGSISASTATAPRAR